VNADALAALDAIPRELLPAAMARLAARVLEPVPAPTPEPGEEAGSLLTADEVAARLHVSKRWVYRHAKWLGAVRLSAARVRFTEQGVGNYVRAKGSKRKDGAS
jgi:hypothetical protein